MIYRFFKRLFDIILSLIGLPFLLLIMLVVAPLIYFSDRGPVFYNAQRLGKDGKVFKMYKFRSMKVNSPNLKNADGSTYNADDDPRVTKIGRILRKTSIDETPQLLNVLFGHMSFIGPRAHLTTNYKGFDTLDDVHQRRLAVRPGITGYSQAYFRNSITSDKKLENDIYYVEHMSLWLDIKILFQTVRSVLKQENIYVAPENASAAKVTDAEKQSDQEASEVGKK